MTTEIQVAAITVTPVAANKLQTLLQERSEPDCGLRVFVSGSGCSGMQYGMAFEADPRDFDEIFECEGIKLIVDPDSLHYLYGANIDFVDTLTGGGFQIHNPSAVSSCGCGHSFRTEDSGTASGGGCGC